MSPGSTRRSHSFSCFLSHQRRNISPPASVGEPTTSLHTRIILVHSRSLRSPSFSSDVLLPRPRLWPATGRRIQPGLPTATSVRTVPAGLPSAKLIRSSADTIWWARLQLAAAERGTLWLQPPSTAKPRRLRRLRSTSPAAEWLPRTATRHAKRIRRSPGRTTPSTPGSSTVRPWRSEPIPVPVLELHREEKSFIDRHQLLWTERTATWMHQ